MKKIIENARDLEEQFSGFSLFLGKFFLYIQKKCINALNTLFIAWIGGSNVFRFFLLISIIFYALGIADFTHYTLKSIEYTRLFFDCTSFYGVGHFYISSYGDGCQSIAEFFGKESTEFYYKDEPADKVFLSRIYSEITPVYRHFPSFTFGDSVNKDKELQKQNLFKNLLFAFNIPEEQKVLAKKLDITLFRNETSRLKSDYESNWETKFSNYEMFGKATIVTVYGEKENEVMMDFSLDVLITRKFDKESKRFKVSNSEVLYKKYALYCLNSKEPIQDLKVICK